jgi:tetratricopeptide (TPR) repeat protein
MTKHLKQWLILSLAIPVIALGFPGWAEAPETAHIEAAKGYMEAEQWQYAGYEWRMALEQNPNSLDANIGLAEMLLKSGHTEEAISHLELARNAIQKLPLDMVYGKALEQKGSYVKAAVLYQRMMNKSPLEPNVFGRLMALEPKLPAKQKKSLKIYLGKMAQSTSKKGNLALKEGKYNAAARYFAISTAYLPNDRDLNNYGAALLLVGNYDAAKAQFDKLKKAASGKWEYFANAAFASLGKGDSYDAATHMERAISLCDDNTKKPLLYNDLGYIYESRRKWAQARSAYERAIELNPRFTKAQFNLAYVYQKERNYESAIKVYKDMLARERNNTKALNRLGFVYELAHEERKAISTYKLATKVKPNEKDAFYNLSLLYRKMGEIKAADQAFKQMMAIEFNQLETSGDSAKAKGNPASNSRVTAKNGLLDFADVFFVEPG